MTSATAVRWASWGLLIGALDGGCSCGRSGGAPPLGDAAPPGKLGTTPNLIVNGDAESAPGSPSGDVVVTTIPAWTRSGNANALTYGARGGYPTATDPGPVERGANFFSGGPDDPVSVFTQHIDLGRYTSFIARGNVTVALSGYLGGYAEQDDNAVLKVVFLHGSADAGSPSLGVVTLGPVLAADRKEDTGLLARATTGLVPAGTMSIDLQLTMTRTAGSANDGYADNLALTLTDEPADAGAGADAPVDAPAEAGAGDDATDAPSPPADSGPVGDASVVLTRSDAAIYLDDQFARFVAGLPADLNGDGIPDTFVEALSGGGTRTRRDLDENGVNEVVTDVDSGGNSTSSIDDDGDGVVDRTVTTQVGPPFVRVERWDEDHDGLFERRRTSTSDATADTIHVVVEVDETAAHTSTVLSDDTVDLIEGAGGGVDRACMHLPMVDPDDPGPARSDNIRIPTNESAPSGYCNKQEALRLNAAFDCAKDQMHKHCLDNLDKDVMSRIEDALKDHGMRITCGLCFGDLDAATEVGGSLSAFNHLHLAVLSDPALCEAASHELMHMAGFAGGIGHATDHNDKVYACARTCNGCTDSPPVGPGISTSSGRDCAMCAEGENKMKCGSKPKLVATSCLPQYSVCRSGLLAYTCPDCKTKQLVTCDDAMTVADTGFTCCQACDNANDPNFAPCSEPPKECTDKPAYCP
ncbi:MAG TPA: hypothetical protein VFA96_06095 [Nocardioides sp.]|nr:hypothetical protein [Nocardioides sp.]